MSMFGSGRFTHSDRSAPSSACRCAHHPDTPRHVAQHGQAVWAFGRCSLRVWSGVGGRSCHGARAVRARCKLGVYLGTLPVMIATIRPLGTNQNCPEASGIYWQQQKKTTRKTGLVLATARLYGSMGCLGGWVHVWMVHRCLTTHGCARCGRGVRVVHQHPHWQHVGGGTPAQTSWGSHLVVPQSQSGQY